MRKYKLKKLLKRINEFLEKINYLPDKVVESSDLSKFYETTDETVKENIYAKTESVYNKAQTLKREVLAFINTFFGECDYKEVVSSLTFRHKTLRANFGNYINDEAFNEDKHILKNVLLQMKADFENGKEINSSKSIFENSLFWVIVVPIVGVAFFIGKFENKYSNNYQTEKYKNLSFSYKDSLIQKKDSLALLINIIDSISLVNIKLNEQIENVELKSKIASELEEQLTTLKYRDLYDRFEFEEWDERTIIILEKWESTELKDYYNEKMNEIKKEYYSRDDYKLVAKNTMEKILLKIK